MPRIFLGSDLSGPHLQSVHTHPGSRGTTPVLQWVSTLVTTPDPGPNPTVSDDGDEIHPPSLTSGSEGSGSQNTTETRPNEPLELTQYFWKPETKDEVGLSSRQGDGTPGVVPGLGSRVEVPWVTTGWSVRVRTTTHSPYVLGFPGGTESWGTYRVVGSSFREPTVQNRPPSPESRDYDDSPRPRRTVVPGGRKSKLRLGPRRNIYSFDSTFSTTGPVVTHALSSSVVRP